MNPQKDKLTNYSSKDISNIKELLKSQEISEYDPEIIPKLLDIVFQMCLKTAKGCDDYTKHLGLNNITPEIAKYVVSQLDDCSILPPISREDLMNYASDLNSTALSSFLSDSNKNPLHLPPPNTCMVQPDIGYTAPKSVPDDTPSIIQFQNFGIVPQTQNMEQKPNVFPFSSAGNQKGFIFQNQINPNLR